MLSILISKELRFILTSPKFTAMFLVASVLILLSVFIGIQEYTSSVRQFESATQLADQEIREARNWMSVSNRVYRRPDPMQVFASGVEYDVGRTSGVSTWSPIKLVSSAYSNDPIFALFRNVDLVFIMSVILTLFAILFSYDAVNGERESGTLALVFSNAVPRAQYLIAKLVGSWVGLVVPLLIPILLSFVMVIVFGVPMTAGHWLRLAGLVGMSLLLFTFFLVLGLLVSSWTRRSDMSFLVSLTVWIMLVLILPRAAVMIAGQIVPVPSVAEIESRMDSYSKDRWEASMTEMSQRWRGRQEEMEGMSKAEQDQYRQDHEWDWAEEDDIARKAVQRDIEEQARMTREEQRNRKLEQERIAFLLSRFSPVSAFHLAGIDLAGTDVGVKERYEDALNQYRTTFIDYRDRKQKESGASGGIRISIDSETGVKIDTGREIELDVSDMPRFDHPVRSIGSVASSVVVDGGLIAVMTILCFAGAFVGFVRYDVR